MDRISRYSGLKTRSVEMEKFISEIRNSDSNHKRPLSSNQIKKIHGNLFSCANYLLFHDYYTIDELRLAKANTCKQHLLCPFCAARRASKMLQINQPKVEQIMADNPSLKPVMLTLPVKNGPNLSERQNHLSGNLKRLIQRRRHNTLRGDVTEFSKIAGAIYSYEVTNIGNGWHPHVHMVCLLNDWIDQKALSKEWHALTGDSFIVDVRRIKPQDMEGTETLTIATGMMEVLKYAVKFQDMSLEDNWDAYQTLRRKRLIGSFGLLHGVKQPDSLLDETLDDLPYLERFYRYSRSVRGYDLLQTRRFEAVKGA